jgi:type II secretory pathway component PulL
VVVAGTAVAGAEAWRLRRESDALAETIAQAARYAFPDAPDISQPRVLLEQSVEAQAGPAPGSAKFLDTLQSVAAAVAATREARLEAVNYRTGIIDLQIRAPSADSLDRIRQQVVDGAGLKAEIQSANADGDQIQGRIRISAGGA